MEKCKYEGCNYEVNSPNDEEFCLFHAPSKKKGVEEVVYNTKLNEHIKKFDFNFKGFIFPWIFTLRNSERENNIRKAVNFDNCIFEGNDKVVANDFVEENVCLDFKDLNFFDTVSFANAEFKNSAIFNYITTKNSNISFFGAIFIGNSYFRNTSFNNSHVNFEKAKFKQTADFFECKFIDNNENILQRKNVNFKGAEFQETGKNGTTIFTKAEFSVRNIDFSDCKFYGSFFNFDKIVKLNCDKVEFTKSVIDSSVNFKSNIFSCTLILFNDVKFNSSVIWDDTVFNSLNLGNQSHLFANTQFNGFNSFKNVTFNCGTPDFTKSIFRAKTDFIDTKFRNGVNFTETKFGEFELFESLDKEDTEFFQPLLKAEADSTHSILFENVQFEGSKTCFIKCIFLNVVVSFEGNTFQSKLIFRDDLLFGVSNIFFEKDYFYSDIEFIDLKFFHKCKIELDFVDFSNRSFVTFENFAKGNFLDVTISNFNKLEQMHKNNKYIVIMFRNIKFPEHKTFFQKINERNDQNDAFLICFRHSYVNNVYFIKNNMSVFSFYSSIFNSAIFTSNTWSTTIVKILFSIPFKVRGKNLIPEDIFYRQWQMKDDYDLFVGKNILETKSFLKDFNNFSYKTFLLGEDFNRNEIANLYRIFKVSLDNAKDYRQAGGFYFNEFEMSRLALKSEKGFWNFSKYISYNVYKVICGYGEKPFWSFLWFWYFTFLFSIVNLWLIGFNYKNEFIEYNFDFNNISNFLKLFWIKDFYTSFLFTISRVIPSNFPLDKTDFASIGLLGISFNILTSIVLLFLIIMTGVGVKRHFRRF